MSGTKKKHILNTVSVKLGCRSSLAALFSRRPRHSHHHRHPYNSSSSSTTTTAAAAAATTATFSSSAFDTPPPCYSSSDPEAADVKSLRAVQGFGRLGGESLAVEKDSDDPYLDFRRSMLQMILENELYSKDDLRHLLNCFLQLNSPYYHSIIVRAFTEIWNGGAVCSVMSSESPNSLGMWSSGDYF